MATGIVSIAASDHGYRWLSVTLAALATVALPVLMVLTAAGHRTQPLDRRNPDVMVRLFSYVAACAVLGARYAEHRIVVWIFAGMALQAWAILAPVVLRSMWRYRWTGLRDRARGAWELAAVGTIGVAIVSAHSGWLFGALLFWMLGIVTYAAMTALILWRTVHERWDRDGFEPDSWILMGGLAIATLAGDHIHHIWPVGPVESVTKVTWVLATSWIPVLVFFGLRRVRRHREVLRVPTAWWAMVFPLGMYSAATFAMALETGWSWLPVVSLAFCWVALVAWLAVVVVLAARGRSLREG